MPVRAYQSKLPVVSVGSIVAGGSGKTPLVLFLLAKLPINTAVLSRGYLSAAEHTVVAVEAIKKSAVHAKEIGDEACLIAKKSPSTLIVVGKNRAKSAIVAERKGAKLILLDDGMQQLHLKKDFEIITLMEEDLLRPPDFIPRGIFREHFMQLKRADLIVFYGAVIPTSFIRSYTPAPIVQLQKKSGRIVSLKGKLLPPKELVCGAFCALARPEAFFYFLAAQGFVVVDSFLLRDHRAPNIADLHSLWDKASQKGATFLLCSEKDAVKIPPTIALPIYYIEIDLEVVAGQKELDSFVEKIQCLM